LIVLLCTGATLQARADKTQAYAWGDNDYGQLGDGTYTGKSLAVTVSSLTNVVQVAGGAHHSLALKSDGTLWTWGGNDTGQLGDGTNDAKNTPVPVAALSGVMQIAAGGFHSLALKSDGTVWAWGWNQYGQLGDGTTSDKNAPVQVTGISGIVQVSGGGGHSLALKSDGTVWTWGANDYGQLGDGTTTNRSAPVQVAGLTGVAQVAAAAGSYSLALKSDGTVWAWGANGSGQLGDGTYTGKTAPVQSGISGVAQVVGGRFQALALKPDGTVWAWGGNYYGQLGDGTNTNRNTPVQVSALTGVIQVARGGDNSLALKSNGAVWAWGDNDYGQLGDGTTTNRNTPVQVLGLAGVAQVAGGSHHSLSLGKVVSPSFRTTTSLAKRNLFVGLTTVLEAKLILKGTTTPVAGEMLAFSVDGTYIDSAVTDGAGVARVSLVLSYPAGAHPYKALFTGSGVLHASSSSATLTLTAFTPVRGTVYAWGDNTFGALGTGFNYPTNVPMQVKGLSKVVQVAGGGIDPYFKYGYSLALKSDGTVWAWGYNFFGQLGDGTNIHRNTPVQVSGLTGAVQVSAGSYHSLALKSDGTVWAWGSNGSGQLGNGTQTPSRTPVQVLGLSNVVQVSAGGGYFDGGTSLALKSDGTVWGWGSSFAGALGEGISSNVLTPIKVAGIANVVQIALGEGHSLALKPDGTVWAWGDNFYGQLGDGSRFSNDRPTQVAGLNNVVQVLAGAVGSFALKSDGTVQGWGYNREGELGAGTDSNQYSPVQASGLFGVVQIGGGSFSTLAIKSDGTLWAWGANREGEVGDSTNLDRKTPVQVPTLVGQTGIAGGVAHSLSVTAVPRNTITSTISLKVTYGTTILLTGKLRLTGVVTLPVKPLVFSIDGVVVGTALTDASGTARLTLGSPIAPGVHSLDVAFAGDGNFNASGASATIAVKAATTLSQKSVSGNMGSAVNLAATLTRTVGGALLANKTVTFYVDGASVGTATTDANGVATLSYTITQTAGKFALKANFDGDNDYLASSFTRASLVVK